MSRAAPGLLWRMAGRGLLRHGRRNLVTALAIALGFSGLVLMGAYIVRCDKYLGTNTVYSNYVGSLAIFPRGGASRTVSRDAKDALSIEAQAKILAALTEFPQIEFTAKVLRGSGLLASGCRSMPFVAIGIERSKLAGIEHHPEIQRWTPELARPKLGIRLSESSAEDAISLTGLLASSLGKPKVLDQTGGKVAPVAATCEDPQVRDAIRDSADIQLVARSFTGDFSAVDAQVVGHHSTGMAFTEETSMIAPLELLQRLYGTDAATYIAVYLRPGESTRFLEPRITERLLREGLDLEVIPYFDERVGAFYQGVMRFLFTMTGFFLILVIAMISVTIVNFVTVGLLERTREIGTLRAIGFDVPRVRALFLRESLLLTTGGLALGMAICLVVVTVVDHAGIRFSPPGIAGDMSFLLMLTPTLCLSVAAFVGAVAVLSAIWRLRTLSRAQVVELLHG